MVCRTQEMTELVCRSSKAGVAAVANQSASRIVELLGRRAGLVQSPVRGPATRHPRVLRMARTCVPRAEERYIVTSFR